VPENTPNRRIVKSERPREPRDLTTTSFVILGLLSVRSWSAYELTTQMRRGLSLYWPRAESGVYDEPKNLIRHGLASARAEATGRRPRTVYAITAKGRRALRRWLAQPSAPPRFECEALVRTVFADSGTKDDLLATLRQMQEQTRDPRGQILSQGVDYLATGGPFPHRLHVIALVGRFLLGMQEWCAEWARQVEEVVEAWPDVAPIPDLDTAIRTFRASVGEDLLRQIAEWEPSA
jgi:PadR family transcriptional regulator, regulatory protein AphA